LYEGADWPVPLVRDALKDELRPVTKCVEGVTRHINPYPFAWLVAQRCFVAPFVVLFMALGHRVTGQLMGINAADPKQWGDVLSHLREIAPDEQEDYQLSDIDNVLYDASLSGELFIALSDVIYTLALRMGWAERHARALRMLIMRYPHYLLAVDGVVAEVYGLQASGVMSTDLTNGVIQWLCVCMAIRAVLKRRAREVARHSHLGDDTVLNVLPGLRDAFNMDAVRTFFRVYGLRITSGSKVETDAMFRPGGEITVLQRKFAERDGGVSAPLAMKRLLRCLWMFAPSQAVS